MMIASVSPLCSLSNSSVPSSNFLNLVAISQISLSPNESLTAIKEMHYKLFTAATREITRRHPDRDSCIAQSLESSLSHDL